MSLHFHWERLHFEGELYICGNLMLFLGAGILFSLYFHFVSAVCFIVFDKSTCLVYCQYILIADFKLISFNCLSKEVCLRERQR